MFHLDVAKVDRDVADVTVAIHYVSSVCSNVLFVFPDICLQVFHLDVAYVFASVLDVCSKCFSCFCTYVASVFICIFQK
jgi:hypothetical protein